jgi:hypothetical protein
VRRWTGSITAVATCLVGLLASCEIAVPDDVPTVSCVPAAGACPAGETCDVVTHTCVSMGVGGDASEDGPALPLMACSTLGCQCSGPQDCGSGICGDTTVVTPSVHAAAQNTSFCTTPCCTSADCDAATVCLATGTGASYCVLPQWLDRPTNFGALLGGASCEGDGDCRSGLCAAGVCADTCCSTAQSAAECANGDVCQFGTFPGKTTIDMAFVPSCSAPGGSSPTGSACTTASDCRGGLCTPDGQCHDACRDTADCGDPTLECGYFFPNLMLNELVSACETSYGGASKGGQGASCGGNGDCQTGFCDAMSMECTDVCYTDSDCTPQGWRCRPDVTLDFDMQSYSVFACGP